MFHRTLPAETRGWFPKFDSGDLPAGVLLDGPELKLWSIARDQQFVLAQATQPVVWVGQSATHLVVITTDELLIFDRHAQSLVHRRARPAKTFNEADVRWVIHPEGLLMLAPPREVALFDLASGDWRWRRTAEGAGWQRTIGWNETWLAIHPLAYGSAELWNLVTGTIQRRDHPPTPPWRMAPVFVDQGESYFSVNENDRLVIHASQSPGHWEFAGVITQTHTAPWVFRHGTDVLAVIDGTRLAQIAQDSGWPRWSTLIADVPLAAPSQQTMMGNGIFFSASAGLLRAVDLNSGQSRWSTRYRTSTAGRSDRCWLSTSAAIVAVLPDQASVTSQNPRTQAVEITLYSTATGRPLQTLKLPTPSLRVELAELSPTHVSILTDHDLLVYED